MIQNSKYRFWITFWVSFLTVINHVIFGVAQESQYDDTACNGLGGTFIIAIVVFVIIALVVVMGRESRELGK